MKKALLESLAEMEEVLSRVSNRCDIWQDRCIYVMAKAVWLLLTREIKKMEKEKKA